MRRTVVCCRMSRIYCCRYSCDTSLEFPRPLPPPVPFPLSNRTTHVLVATQTERIVHHGGVLCYCCCCCFHYHGTQEHSTVPLWQSTTADLRCVWDYSPSFPPTTFIVGEMMLLLLLTIIVLLALDPRRRNNRVNNLLISRGRKWRTTVCTMR